MQFLRQGPSAVDGKVTFAVVGAAATTNTARELSQRAGWILRSEMNKARLQATLG